MSHLSIWLLIETLPALIGAICYTVDLLFPDRHEERAEEIEKTAKDALSTSEDALRTAQEALTKPSDVARDIIKINRE